MTRRWTRGLREGLCPSLAPIAVSGLASAQIEQVKLRAGDGLAGDRFGFSVAASVDTLVIGAPGQGLYQQTFDRGAAYLFGVTVFADGFESGDSSLWSEQEPLP